MTSAEIALLTTTAAHLGFQATVTAVVYPALARVPGAQWLEAHRAHSRAITPLVVVVYGSLLAAAGWALWAGPDAWTWVALAAGAAAMAVTAFAAAPAHGRLAGGHDPHRVGRLLRADRLRLIAAGVALIGALPAIG